MNDVLSITDLELWTRIGVPAEERSIEQRVLVTVEMTLDTRSAAKADDVKKSINYFDVAQDMKALATKERKTIERLAEDIAKLVLKKYKPEEVAVTVKKFALPATSGTTLRICRRR